MIYTSNNLLSLKDTTTGELTQFIPNSNIILPKGEYINQNEARLIGKDGSVVIIKAGETVKDSAPVGKDEVQKFNKQVPQGTPKTRAKRDTTKKPIEPEPTKKDSILDLLDGN